MNKKLIIILAVIIVIIGLVGILLLLRGDEDTWLCQNGQWVKHGNPSASQPTTGCGNQTEQPDIIVTTPQKGQIITSPLTLTGQAKGSWYFEASAPVKLVDEQGKELAAGNIQAQGDWMTTDYVPFKGELKFLNTATTSGTLILQNDNPSGLPANQRELKIPVVISAQETIKIKAYFNNDRLDPQITCYKVFPVAREIPKTQAVARAALEELLKGVTDQEKAQGYLTSINPGVVIQKLDIIQGVAKVDFDETLERAVGGSCRVTAIRSQITQTLEQFSTVEQVVISINGRTEDILQP